MDYDNSPLPTPLTDVVERTPSLRRAYVLFMDIVGFSRLPTDHQVAAQTELVDLVQITPEVIAARSDPDNFIVRPTGDGMALLFFKDLLSPIRAALQIHSQLQADSVRIKQLVGAPLKLRMGIHAGEVTIVQDVNGHSDAAGDGIITAQRVMDMGDADHILLSSEIAKVLINMDPWARYITHLGEVRVKHKVVVDLFNLYGRLDGPFCGNPGTPRKVAEDGRARNREARAARPKLTDILMPYRKSIVTMIVLGGLAYGGNAYYKVNPGPFRQAWAAASAKMPFLNPAKPEPPKPNPKITQGGNRRGGKRGSQQVASTRPVPVVEKVTVPNLIGSETHDADAAASGSGLSLKIIQGGYTKFAENTVYNQKPPAGASVRRDSVVTVYVSRGIKAQGDGSGVETGDPGDSPSASGDPGEKSSDGENGSSGGE